MEIESSLTGDDDDDRGAMILRSKCSRRLMPLLRKYPLVTACHCSCHHHHLPQPHGHRHPWHRVSRSSRRRYSLMDDLRSHHILKFHPRSMDLAIPPATPLLRRRLPLDHRWCQQERKYPSIVDESCQCWNSSARCTAPSSPHPLRLYPWLLLTWSSIATLREGRHWVPQQRRRHPPWS